MGYATINEPLPGTIRIGRADRWKALPFLLLMMSSGLPLNYKLEPARPMAITEVAELTLEATSSANFANSILFVMFLAVLYVVSISMLLKRPKQAGTMLMQLWPLCLILLLIAASMTWTFDQSKVVTNIAHNLGTTAIAMAAALYYRHDPWRFPRDVGIVLGINMLIHIAAVIAIPSYAIDWQGRWHGLTTHPNTLGAMSVTTLWANAAVLICKKSRHVVWHYVFSAAAVLAMLGADSVTSIMTSMAVLALIYTFKKLHQNRVGQQFYVCTLVIILLCTFIAILIGNAFDFSGLFQLFGRDANLTGRTSVWEDAMAAISLRPLLGWSFDDHAYLIQKGMPYPSYHNGFLDVLVSGGVAAFILLLLLLGKWATRFSKPYLVAKTIAPFSASFVIAYLIHNLTESSLISPRGQLWEIFLALIFLSTCRKWDAASNAQVQGQRSGLPPLKFDTIVGSEFKPSNAPP
jgi:O-antigen ligase